VLRADWRLAVWAVLSLPALLYFVLGGFPATSGLQDAVTGAAGGRLLTGVAIAALAWIGYQVAVLLRGWPATRRGPDAERPARSYLRLCAGAGALAIGGWAVTRVLTGSRLDQRAVSGLHLWDALRGALLAVVLLAVVALLLTAFPPGGAALAVAGGGALGAGAALTPSVVGTTAVVGALSGWLHAAATADGGGGGGSGERRDNRDDFDEDDFEYSGHSEDELTEMIYRHTGSGDMHIGGSPPRPTFDEIQATLRHGTRIDVRGDHSVGYIRNGVKVIVNRAMPWRSTSYYSGG
jgi:hypothetical protein